MQSSKQSVKAKNKCLIVSGGQENQINDLVSGELKDFYVIACDKGYEYCINQNITVDYLCGDFDSCKVSVPLKEEITDGVDVLPTHKDDTDLVHALKYAINKTFKEIVVVCAAGGRIDHFLSNIQALVFAKSHSNIKVSLCDDSNEIIIIQNETVQIRKRDGWSLSVLSFSDKSEGVTISGAEYEVCDVTLTNGFPLGQSNEWNNEVCNISVRNGILLVIMSKK